MLRDGNLESVPVGLGGNAELLLVVNIGLGSLGSFLGLGECASVSNIHSSSFRSCIGQLVFAVFLGRGTSGTLLREAIDGGVPGLECLGSGVLKQELSGDEFLLSYFLGLEVGDGGVGGLLLARGELHGEVGVL